MTWAEARAEIARLTGETLDEMDAWDERAGGPYHIVDADGEAWNPTHDAYGEGPYEVVKA